VSLPCDWTFFQLCYHWTDLCFFIYEKIPLILLTITFPMVVQLCFDMTNCNIVPGLPDNSNSRTTKMLFKKYGSTKKEVVLNFSLTYYVYMYDCWTCCSSKMLISTLSYSMSCLCLFNFHYSPAAWPVSSLFESNIILYIHILVLAVAQLWYSIDFILCSSQVFLFVLSSCHVLNRR
jgi:hypothetical protein